MEPKMIVEVQLVSEHTKLTWRCNRTIRYPDIYDFIKGMRSLFFENDSPVRVSIDIAETFDDRG